MDPEQPSQPEPTPPNPSPEYWYQRTPQEQLDRITAGLKLRDFRSFAEMLGAQYDVNFEGTRHSLKFRSGLPDLQLPESYQKVEWVTVPPDEAEIRTGSETGWIEPGTVPRSRFLIEVLTDLDILYAVREGQVDRSMVRKQPYRAFHLLDMDIVVLLCNEEDNATYVVYRPEELPGETLPEELTKEELRSYIPRGNVRRFVYPGDETQWKTVMRNALTTPPLVTVDELTREFPILAEDSLIENAPPPGAMPREPSEAVVTMEIPSGWRTLQELSDEYGPSKHWFRAHLDLFAQQNTDHKRPGISNGVRANFYSPDAVAHVLPQLPPNDRWQTPSEDWRPLTLILEQYRASIADVSSDVGVMQRRMPDEFKQYSVPGKSGGGRQWYVSPKAASVLETLVSQRLSVRRDRAAHPDHPNWMVAEEIRQESGSHFAHKETALAAFVDWLPIDQAMVIQIGNRTYYQRAFVELVKPVLGQGLSQNDLDFYFKQVQMNREGSVHTEEDLRRYFGPFLVFWERVKHWHTNASLARVLGVSLNWVLDHLTSLRSEHPELFSQGADRSNARTDRIDPQAERYLRPLVPEHLLTMPPYARLFRFNVADFRQASPAPDSWLPLDVVAQQLGFDDQLRLGFRSHLSKAKDRLLGSQLIRPAVGQHGAVQIFVAPDGLSLLLETRQRAPAGWITASSLRTAHRLSPEERDVLVEEFRSKYPDKWAEFYSRQGMATRYYHPDINTWVQSDALDTRPRPAPGYQTIEEAVASTGVPESFWRKAVLVAKRATPQEVKTYYPVGSRRPREFLAPSLLERTAAAYRLRTAERKR